MVKVKELKKVFRPIKIVQSSDGKFTTVYWGDGNKTVVKCEDGTVSDNYEAFTAALAKKVFGSNSAVKKIVSKTERIKPEILNSKEKDYLMKYVVDNPCYKLWRKTHRFACGSSQKRGKILHIVKRRYDNKRAYLDIHFLQNGYDYYCNLPLFDCSSMFLEMEEEREYTLKELGLEEKEKKKEIDLPW